MKNNSAVITIIISLFIASAGFRHISGAEARKPAVFLAMSAEMRELLDREVIPVRGEKRRLDKIVELIFDRSVVGFDYSSITTNTASETFEKRSGNCLSYTAMFIAMARYTGLNARFQEVADFSDWSRQGETVVFSSHINSVVIIGTKYYEVDFQYRIEKKFWNRRIISDSRAEAHYYNNIGSEALLAGDLHTAEKLLSRGLELDKSFSFAWSNLGVLLKKRGETGKAEECFSRAIALNSHNHTAKYNLALILEQKGNFREAAKLKKEIKRVLKKNPYYHFRLGIDEYEKGNYRRAVDHFRRAVRRNPKESEFYIKLSAAYYKLGDFNKSEKYLTKGQKHAKTDIDRDKYKKKLEYIYIKLKNNGS